MRSTKDIIVFVLKTLMMALPALAQENTDAKSKFPIQDGSYFEQKPPGNTPQLFAPSR